MGGRTHTSNEREYFGTHATQERSRGRRFRAEGAKKILGVGLLAIFWVGSVFLSLFSSVECHDPESESYVFFFRTPTPGKMVGLRLQAPAGGGGEMDVGGGLSAASLSSHFFVTRSVEGG